MINAPAYQGKTIGVFGLARTGLAAVHALASSGARVLAWDDNADRVAAVGDYACDLYTADFAELDALLLAPGVPLTHPKPHTLVVKAQASGVPLISDFDVFEAARPNLPYHHLIAITGTNGKSTTTALVAHIIGAARRPVAMGGNIGTGLLDLDPLPEGGVYVVEASSFQIDLTQKFAADVAVLLNVTPDHLDRHGSMDAYVAAKAKLFQMQASGACQIISADDSFCRAVAAHYNGRTTLSTMIAAAVDVSAVDGLLIDHRSGEAVVNLADCPALRGAHNHQNAAAAFAACRAVGLHCDEIAAGLKSFGGLVHRQEHVKSRQGVLYVNDSKATNMEAASRALASFENIRWLAGGRSKGEQADPVRQQIGRVKKAYFFGEAGSELTASLGGHVNHATLLNLPDALEAAHREAEEGDCILLSPACTAFDAYKNFEERGDAFKALVERLAP